MSESCVLCEPWSTSLIVYLDEIGFAQGSIAVDCNYYLFFFWNKLLEEELVGQNSHTFCTLLILSLC